MKTKHKMKKNNKKHKQSCNCKDKSKQKLEIQKSSSIEKTSFLTKLRSWFLFFKAVGLFILDIWDRLKGS